MTCLGVIPVRFQSKRFPGKALVHIQGKPLLHWVFERATQCSQLDSVVVATDDDRIFYSAQRFGAKVQKTSVDCLTGSDRVAEVLQGSPYQTVLNIQVDYPDIQPESLGLLVNYLQKYPEVPIVTLKQPFSDKKNIQSSHHVKVYCDSENNAVKFTRDPSLIPSLGEPYEHVGVYGFQREALLQFAKWEQGTLEKEEKLEQLRALENGMAIKVLTVSKNCHGINIPEDIPVFLKSL